MSHDYDPGPSASMARLFAAHPSYEPHRKSFWYDWGPVYYRGRLGRKARLLAVASDPGPSERIACRTLVGDAGQRVQGFFTKLGLTSSYVCLNALVYALFPSHWATGVRVIEDPAHTAWRNRVFNRVDSNVQAVVAFGANARRAVALWPRTAELPVFEVPHPSSRDETVLLDAWRDAVTALRRIVTPDADGDPTLPNYGATFTEADYSPIPALDLPYGLPSWFGDDSWGRNAPRRHNNSVRRGEFDDIADAFHQMLWLAPDTAPD